MSAVTLLLELREARKRDKLEGDGSNNYFADACLRWRGSKGKVQVHDSNLELFLLHVPDSVKVREDLDLLIASDLLEHINGDGDAINTLKYIARLHGLPPSVLKIIDWNYKDGIKGNGRFDYKVTSLIKYAVQHNHDFIALARLLEILFKLFPLENITSPSKLDVIQTEIIAQLLYTITSILNPGRVLSEKLIESDIRKLENYLQHISMKHRSEIKRRLQKMGYISDLRSDQYGYFDKNENSLIKDGEEIIRNMQTKRGMNVTAHVIKTQQTEAVATHENVSEKIQIANISLSNSLQSERSRTTQLHRKQEILPLPKSSTESELRWYRTVPLEIDNLFQIAKDERPICPDDLKYLSEKLARFVRSVFVLPGLIPNIAQIFANVAKYQEIDTSIILNILDSMVTLIKRNWDNSAVSTENILRATYLHCVRLDNVPESIATKLQNFLQSESGNKSSEKAKQLIMEILMIEKNPASETILGVLEMLKDEKQCMMMLNYIHRQMSTELRSQCLKKSKIVDCILQFVVDRVQTLKHFPKHASKVTSILEKRKDEGTSEQSGNDSDSGSTEVCIQKALQVLEDYLDLKWTPGLSPDDCYSLIHLANTKSSVVSMRSSTCKIILKSIEKGLNHAGLSAWIDIDLGGTIRNVFIFLLDTASNEDDETVDESLRTVIVIMLSNIFANEMFKCRIEWMKLKHVEHFLRVMKAENGILIEKRQIIPPEKLKDYSEDEYEFASALIARILVPLLEENPLLAYHESVVTTMADIINSTSGKMTKILCAEYFFKLAATNFCGIALSSSVLSRIRGLALSSIFDVRIYISAAYCTSLKRRAKRKQPLDLNDVNFLGNLYQFKIVNLAKTNLAQWINPNILLVFRESINQNLYFSEHVFNLLAKILNTTCADLTGTTEYKTVQFILSIILKCCESEQKLPESLAKEVEHLLLKSDIFDEQCAAILQYMSAKQGRWFSEAVIEEFSKYLWHEPSASSVFISRLMIANDCQELPGAIFSSCDMESISMSLYVALINMKSEQILKDDVKWIPKSLFKFTVKDEKALVDMLKCLTMYVSKGMVMSILSLNAVKSLLIHWKGKAHETEAVLKCLSVCASNSQALPMEIIELGLDLGNGAAYVEQLNFAIEVVRRSQQLPFTFSENVYKKVGTIQGRIKTQEERKIIHLIQTMIQHNHHIPDSVILLYSTCMTNNKEILSVDMISSVIRLVEGTVVATATNAFLSTCKEIFKFAIDSKNETFFDLGVVGFSKMPQNCLFNDDLKILKSKGIKIGKETKSSKNSFDNKLWRMVQLSSEDSKWKERWDSKSFSQLETAICTDVEFVIKIGNLLTQINGPLNQFEEVLVEMICISSLRAYEKRNERNDRILDASKDILIETILGKRGHSFNSFCCECILHITKEGCEWTRKLISADNNVLDALSEFNKMPNDTTAAKVLKILNNDDICMTYSRDILKILQFVPPTSKFGISSLSSLLPFGKQNKEPHLKQKVEHLIINQHERIPPIVLYAYTVVLRAEAKTPFLEDCIDSLVEYFHEYQDKLGCNEKRLIFQIFRHGVFASDKACKKILQIVSQHLENQNDPFSGGECFCVLKVLRENGDLGDHNKLWEKMFSKLYHLYGESHIIQESPYTVRLLQILMTSTNLDRSRLPEMEESTWDIHLMATDMTLALSSSIHEELELFSEVKEYCSRITDPQERLYVIYAIKDYMKKNKGFPPSKILHCINELQRHTRPKNFALWCSPSFYIKNQIFLGLAIKLCLKFQDKIEDVNSNVIIITLEQATTDSNPIPLRLLEHVIQMTEDGTATFHLFKELLDFVKENQGNELLNHFLGNITRPMKLIDLIASTKAWFLFSYLSISMKKMLREFENLETHIKHVLADGYSFPHLVKMFKAFGEAIESSLTTTASGMEIMENVFYQLAAYQVSHERFPFICETLLTKQIAEWVTTCNELVMEQLYTGLQGTKPSQKIASEFLNLNSMEEKDSFLSDFESNVTEIQNGNLNSSFTDASSMTICNWGPSEIKVWSSIILDCTKKEDGVKWSPEFLKEVVAVISRSCVILKNYRLTPIQILSIYSTTKPGANKGRLLQVSTGSGKSTIIAALAVIRILMGYKVDIFTSSQVLAERDAITWTPFYEMFGFTCGHNGDKGSGYVQGPKPCYKKDIVYGETSQFQFDSLRHEYSGLETKGQRTYSYALIDEVDAMLVDDSSKLARLACSIPGMDLLQPMYHLIWQRLHDVQKMMCAVGENVYYLEGFRRMDVLGNMHYNYMSADGKENHITHLIEFILRNQDSPKILHEALIYKVENINNFVVNHLTDYIHALIGDHSFKENAKDAQHLPLPKHLMKFARSQVKNWVDSALTAVAFSENAHYLVDQGQIKPVDYYSTGTIQASTNWNNGLHQFLQIKHSLKMSSETMETNFLSNMALFQKYGSNLVGFTGTLGSVFGQSMLQEVYSVETIVIPELYYKRFHELPAKIFNSKPKWLQAVAQSALHESFRKRAVLVICQTIGEAENVAEQIKAQQHVKEVKNSVELKLYTRNDRNQEHRVEKVIPGDIIVATNLAGRGTDINTVSVDQYGGLHVILTFLPDSLRVEQQAFGRTARQGAKGTGEIIVLTDTKHVDCNRLKASRDELEVAKLKRFKEKELPIIFAKDKLFSKFCNIYTIIRHQLYSKATEKLGFNGLSVIEQTILNAIEQLWAFFLKRIDDNEIKLSESDITNEYTEFEKHLMEACRNEDKIISTTENCFYWIQIGNEYYRRGNRKKEDSTKALKSFEKAIQIDEPFTPGAHAGLGFCLLRLHSHKDGDYCRVISLLTYALKSLHEEIGLYCAAQTLIKHRNGRIDSELFKQLTEKINLLGDFCNNIQDTISVVKKSLRSVYVTHISSSLLSFKFKLDDNKPTIPSTRNYGRFELEFHDLTCREDMGRKDQAVDTLRNTKQIEIQVQDQNLIRLMECVGKTIKTFLLQLDGISSISEVKWILQEVKPTAFSIRINKFSSKQMYSLKDSKLHKRRKVFLISEFDGAITREQINPEIDGEFPLISDDDKIVEIYFEGEIEVNQSSIIDKTKSEAQNVSDLEILESFLEPRQDMSLIMTGVTPNAVARNWTTSQKSEGCEENQIKQSQILRLVQYFSKTNSSFSNLLTKDAEIIVSSFRDWNIPFILRLLSMDYNEATFALANSSREREDVKEKALKEIGFQFSTSYIPLEIIRDLKQRSLELFPEVRENSFIPWRSVATLSIVASVQVAVGGFLISSGFGTPFGMRMITEGMSDFLAAHRAYDSRNFSLKDYAIQKGISSVISYGTIGKAALKDAIFGGKSLVTGASVEVVEEAGKRVIANQSLNHTLQTARLNLQSLTFKYAATQGCEHIRGRPKCSARQLNYLQFLVQALKVL